MTSPLDNASVTGSPVTVSGTTVAGNTVYVAATNTDANSATTVVSAPAGVRRLVQHRRPGHGRDERPQRRGREPDRRNGPRPAHDPVRLRARARCVLDVTDPDHDDNGPGNYAYPTSTSFHDGAFDIQAFQVYDAGTDVIFRVRTRDLSDTFGSPLGAQLVDIYVHDPAATDDQHVGGQCVAQVPDRVGLRLEPPDPGAGLRPALRGRVRGDPRHRPDQRQSRSRGSSRSGCPRRRSGSPARAGASRSC